VHVGKFFARNLGGLIRARTCAGPAREGNGRTPSMYVGIAHDRWLIYGKAGVAWAHFEYTDNWTGSFNTTFTSMTGTGDGCSCASALTFHSPKIIHEAARLPGDRDCGTGAD
jgi:hypothetical protein